MSEHCRRGLSANTRAFVSKMKRETDGTGFTSLGKDGVLRTFSKDYAVLDARGLTPDEIKEFIALVPVSIADPALVKELDGVDGSKVTSYKDLFEPEEGILPKKPSEEEAKKRREQIARQRQEFKEKIGGSRAEE